MDQNLVPLIISDAHDANLPDAINDKITTFGLTDISPNFLRWERRTQFEPHNMTTSLIEHALQQLKEPKL